MPSPFYHSVQASLTKTKILHNQSTRHAGEAPRSSRVIPDHRVKVTMWTMMMTSVSASPKEYASGNIISVPCIDYKLTGKITVRRQIGIKQTGRGSRQSKHFLHHGRTWISHYLIVFWITHDIRKSIYQPFSSKQKPFSSRNHKLPVSEPLSTGSLSIKQPIKFLQNSNNLWQIKYTWRPRINYLLYRNAG